MNHSRNALFAAAVISAIGSGPVAAACSAVSPAHTLALAELYTSEGCDSCPPADRWMSGLTARGLGADKVVPLSLHVDYWDYIGWKDPFAQAQFTERQRQIARLANSNLVYTPQVVLAGRDFRGWAGGGFDAQVKAINARPARADIELAMNVSESKVNVTANATAKAGGNATGAAGGTVIALDKDQALLDEVAEDVSVLGGTAHTMIADLTDEAQCEQVIPQIIAQHGRIDGVACRDTPLLRKP